jgi:hypothetical protein
MVQEQAGAQRGQPAGNRVPMPARRLTPVTTATRPRSGNGSRRS